MGFGDPDHPHPLGFYESSRGSVSCFRCEQPIWGTCYGCNSCNHFIHDVCSEIPHTMPHHLHPEHVLTLLPPTSSESTSSGLCDECHIPCLSDKYTFQCLTCFKFKIHFKCFVTPNLNIKHRHPLTLYHSGFLDGRQLKCWTCGFLIDDSFCYGCKECDFYVHYGCTMLPPKVKRHHVHELTFHYIYPQESDLAYCDVCEDDDDEELNRTLSYYYCKQCDYIAHVHCVTAQPERGATKVENFVHEHPLISYRKPRMSQPKCVVCKTSVLDYMYRCSQCDYTLHKLCAEFPKLMNHPRHKDHTLSLRSYADFYPLDANVELAACSYCLELLSKDDIVLICTKCNYTEHLACAVKFSHPNYAGELIFSASNGYKFRCNACGELGEGYSMSVRNELGREGCDLHLECFALPGKLDHGSHSHPIFLVSSPPKPISNPSKNCAICNTEVDLEIWVYCCNECNYVAHLKCAAGDLLSTILASNNQSNLCSITQCEKEQFMINTKPKRNLCSLLTKGIFRNDRPIFVDSDFSDPIMPDVTDLAEQFTSVLNCPKCEQPIYTRAYSCFSDWSLHNEGNSQLTVHDKCNLSLLDQNLKDELNCAICTQLIFPPTYSCAQCQIYFHKSCAELPRKHTDEPDHSFVLLSPSQLDVPTVDCTACSLQIEGYAYKCERCKTTLHVQCASGAPLLKLENPKHSFYSFSRQACTHECRACRNLINTSRFFKCRSGLTFLHLECAMLPCFVKIRVHRHPLQLETDLDTEIDDYFCDVCENALNPNVWVYRCSEMCGDRATFHVSCIVQSKAKIHFRYDAECLLEKEQCE